MPRSTMRTLIYLGGALLAAMTAPVFAAPKAEGAEGLQERNFNCNDKLVVSVFSRFSSLASSICSSYIPVQTATAVVVSTSIPTPPTQVTITVPLTATVTETSTVTTPGSPITRYYNAPYPSETKTILPTPPAAKRSAIPESLDKRNLPPWLGQYAAEQVSSACSCLSIRPSTTTVTSTSVTVAPTPTITATLSATVSTFTTTVTITVEGPRPTFSTCYDYQSTSFNAQYSYLSPTDINTFSVQTSYPSSLIECCNSCYTTPNCITYTYFAIRYGYAYQCNKYVLPGNGALGNPYPLPPLAGYNAQCPLGIFNGTRQLTPFGQPQLAIGPCLNANYLN